MENFNSLKTHLKKYALHYAIGIFFLFFVDLIQLIIPNMIGDIFDGLKDQSLVYKDLILYALKIFGIAVTIFFGRIIWRRFIFGTSRGIEYHLRNDIFTHLEKLSLNFFNRNKTGDLMAYFTNDLGAVRMAIGPGFMMAFDAAVMTCFVILNMLINVNVKLTLIAVIPLPIIAIGGMMLGRSLTIRFAAKQEAYGKLSDHVQERFTGIRVIKTFVQESNEIKSFLKVNQNNMDKNISLIKLFAVLFPVVEIVAGISFLLTLLYGGYLATIGRISLGQFVMFNEFIGMLVWPMIALGWCINIFSQGIASQKRIDKILDEKPEITSPANPLISDFSGGDITINNLTFSYPDTPFPALKDVTMTIPHGKFIAITGKTASGKSTIINLLLRLYNFERDRIYFDGVDLNDIPLEKIRELVGVVTQENFLFSQTIADNIALSLNDMLYEEIVEAAKDANVYTNIMDFPDKFETKVGERGITLSGGQKQRISIARVLVRNPEILILDDALSAVDAKTEEEILENLRRVRKERTTIIISHRISTVKACDFIYVVENGMVVESGTHDELLSKMGYYESINRKQSIEETISRL